MTSTFYISTSIAYVNAPPHIGYALELAQADALARYHRLNGFDTFFLTGTDEHGQKLFQLAQKEGISPQTLVDRNAEFFQNLTSSLHISNDFFIRTTEIFHHEASQKLWQRLVEKGDIYKSSYSGFYCVGCEAFILEKDLAEGKCPIHHTNPERLNEENYFFRLSKYSDQIKSLITSDTFRILPEARKNEMLNIIGEEGLKDVSFSRPRKVLNWGVSVPGDETQVMYVWCDALTNYISGLHYERDDALFKKYWPAQVHLIGKDILRFHGGIWIGMLLSAELPVPKNMYVHGFVTSEGQKMSKSLGNVVDPFGYIEEFGSDALRYYLLREIPTLDDGDFSRKRFLEIYSSELSHTIGNLLHRVTNMVQRYCGGALNREDAFISEHDFMNGYVFSVHSSDSVYFEIAQLVESTWNSYKKHFEGFELKLALEDVLKLSYFANQFVDVQKPWILAKQDENELRKVLYSLLELNRVIALLLAPFIPQTSEKMFSQLGIKEPLAFSSEIFQFGYLAKYTLSTHLQPIFPKMEDTFL
ncbi:methionine--tRNA ligase [Candidatus Peregrinibacteria bacterium]|nr:methionine--tRNA ligase [Candidatus Peregrinibacteria bacterium]